LWDLGRKSQSLNLQLQQRSITTNLALAQFQAPGETGEERYFRQKESIVKAGIEQEQLNISKDVFAAQLTEWTIIAKRSLQEATAQLAAARLSNENAGKIAAAEGLIAATSADMAADLEKANSILSDATGKAGTSMEAAKSYVENFGDTIAGVLTPMGNFGNTLGGAATGMKKFLEAVGFTFKANPNGTTTVTSPTVNGQAGVSTTTAAVRVTPTTLIGVQEVMRNKDLNKNGIIGAASGALFNTTRPTDLTVGEAKGETVAVLRNPRAASMNEFGGGSSSVTVNINGASVRNDNDISSLARQVAVEVERSLSRKGQMFGLRGPSV
jgi:hypothetical protein